MPFWFGSNRVEAWAFNAVYFGLLLLAYEGSLLSSGRPHAVALSRIWPAALGFFAVVAWIVLQWSSWTPEGWHHPIWAMTESALGVPVTGAVTIDPELTALALLRLFTSASVFWLALQLCREGSRAGQFMQALSLIGVVYAAYGLIAFTFFPDRILWFEKVHYQNSLTSTFINRNSYATYAGITLVVSFAVLVSIYRRAIERAGSRLRFQLGALVEATAGVGGLMLLSVFIIAAALMLTGSRGGIISSLFGLVLLCVLFAVGGARRGRFAAIAAVIALALAVGALSIYGGFFFERLGSLDEEASSRLAAYAITLQSIEDSPVLGMGYGTFESVFPMYRDSTLPMLGIWDKAHNTYLEVLQGLGLPIGALFIATVLYLFGLCSMGVVRRQRRASVPAAAVSATVIVGLHALVDFSLQMQAVTLTWAALLGAGVAQSWSSRDETADGFVLTPAPHLARA